MEAGLVVVVTEGGLHYLVRRCDACATTDEPHVVDLVVNFADLEAATAHVLDVTNRPFGLDRIADFQRLKVLTHLAAVRKLRVFVREVDLDDEVEEPLLVV